MGAAEKRQDGDVVVALEQLEKTVGRLCVLLERQLASNDQAVVASRKALATLHPEMDRISADVRRKMRSGKI